VQTAKETPKRNTVLNTSMSTGGSKTREAARLRDMAAERMAIRAIYAGIGSQVNGRTVGTE
jgi:hypothetical protein